MRDYKKEFDSRVDFIKKVLAESGQSGIVFGNSGGKDCALVGILCKAACENTVGIIMPCSSKRNYGADRDDAVSVSQMFNIESRTVDLSPVREAVMAQLALAGCISDAAAANIAPRLRMTALYALAQSEGRLVAGTGNRSETYIGYFTKWGDGAHDFNPISDLTVTEVYEFLEFLGAPRCVIEKAPSAGLFDGQTDESEMGITYRSIDSFLLTGVTNTCDQKRIEAFHLASDHKRRLPLIYSENYHKGE